MDELYRASSLTMHDDPGPSIASTSATAPTADCDAKKILSEDGTKAFCQNCRRFVAEWSFDRHYAHCVAQFYFCASCKTVLKAAERAQHDLALHSDCRCAKCGETIAGGKRTLIAHQKHECLQRAVPCAFCNLPFAFSGHTEHERACGSRTELCPQCNQYIALSLIARHTADVHGCVASEWLTCSTLCDFNKGIRIASMRPLVASRRPMMTRKRRALEQGASGRSGGGARAATKAIDRSKERAKCAVPRGPSS